MSILELRLEDTAASANMIKVLRKYFPNVSVSELKKLIESNNALFLCSEGSYDGKKSMMKIIRGLNREGIQVKICERTDSNTYPVTIKQLQAFIGRAQAIGKQVINDMENEADEWAFAWMYESQMFFDIALVKLYQCVPNVYQHSQKHLEVLGLGIASLN